MRRTTKLERSEKYVVERERWVRVQRDKAKVTSRLMKRWTRRERERWWERDDTNGKGGKEKESRSQRVIWDLAGKQLIVLCWLDSIISSSSAFYESTSSRPMIQVPDWLRAAPHGLIWSTTARHMWGINICVSPARRAQRGQPITHPSCFSSSLDSITGLPFTRTISFASDPSNQPLNHLLPSRCLPRKLLAPPPPPKSRVRSERYGSSER